MEYFNEMEIVFDSRSENEGFARVAVAAFMTQMDPFLEEVADVKTAVSEAVTNSIIHGYEGKPSGKITVWCGIEKDRKTIAVTVKDRGVGIENVKQAMEPLYTTRPDMDRSGMGFAFMEAFMDEIQVESAPGEGTTIRMKKTTGGGKEGSCMDHTIALIRRAHEGDEDARTQLVEENTGLIWCVVKRFYGRGTEAEDLFQIGSIGLLKAIDKFDLTYDVKFSTYAVPMITGEIKRFLRDDGMLKVSRSLKEIAYKAYQAKEVLTEKLGREPLLEEIGRETGVEKEELVMAMEAAGEVESLHKPVGMKDGNEVMLLEKIADTGGAEEKLLDHLLLAELIKELKKDERKLLYLRYFADKTQTEIGEELGISQVQVSRMEKKILKTMREHAKE